MKTDINTLKDLFKIGYEIFESSRIEDKEVRNMYHNRQYNSQQLAILERRGQPPETFNVIKLFARLLVGYYSTIVNTVEVFPTQIEDKLTAMLLNDVVKFTFEQNKFETEGDKVKLDGILSGLMCTYIDVLETGKRDEFNRPIRRIELSHVPSQEIVLDPSSKKEDYSDARYIHRFKWVSKDFLRTVAKDKNIFDKLTAYENFTNKEDTEYYNYYEDKFIGTYKIYDNYLLVHTIIKDDEGKSWSIYWSGDVIIDKKEITYKEVKFPYRIQKVHSSDKAEYYGLFREVIESQKAINQALLKIQLMANSQKALVERGAVEDLDEFTDAFNRVNAVIPVKDIAGINIQNLTAEVKEQYAIIDKALDRIQRILGVNDSFLGMAYASDSGRKVKLQQNATILALRYLTTKIEQMYRMIGWDIVNLVKQFYTASEVIRIADKPTGERWIEINKPLTLWTGEFDKNNQPIMRFVFEEVLDPNDNKPLLDENKNYIMAPVPELNSEIQFSEVDISIDSTAYNDEDEKNQLMLESVLQGPIGKTLMQINPATYLKAAALSIESVRTKHSHEISELIKGTAESLETQMQMQAQMQMQTQGFEDNPRSQELKLPQNTNEN